MSTKITIPEISLYTRAFSQPCFRKRQNAILFLQRGRPDGVTSEFDEQKDEQD
jgi:hypothetical protein